MSGIWIAGGIYFWLHRERHWRWSGHARAGAAGQPVDQRADPCFNEGLNARETISAAMAQRYENIEVIAINDGSSDDTAEVLDQLTLEFPACG